MKMVKMPPIVKEKKRTGKKKKKQPGKEVGCEDGKVKMEK